MCLHLDEDKTNELKEKWKRDGVVCIEGWKRYSVVGDMCISFFRTDNEIDLSRNDRISDRKDSALTWKERYTKEVNQGIHVYLKKTQK